MPPMGDERRTATRARAELRVRVLSPKAMSGFSVDLSESGMLIRVERPPLIPVGKEVQVQFQLSKTTKPIRARGEVMRHEGKDMMGIRFLMLPLEEVQALKAFVAQPG